MRAHTWHLALLASLLSAIGAAEAAVSALCSINKVAYKPYGFLTNCSQWLPLSTRDSLNCVLAAAVSAVPSAAVTSPGGGGAASPTCHVTAALCPRYRMRLDTDPAPVLMPDSLISLEHVVMSVKKGCGQRVWNVMTMSSFNSDYLVQPAHPDAATLPDIFRSSALDNIQLLISRLIYKQFIVQLYVGSTVVVRLVFNVGISTGSVTNLNWFDKARLVQSSPVANLATMSSNIFSIEGDPGFNRRFYISLAYAGCPQDRAMFAVLEDGNDVCDYYRFAYPVPRIAYSSDPNLPMSLTIRDADYFAILVR